MNKKELILQAAKKSFRTQKSINDILNILIEVIQEELKNDRIINIEYFGKFEVRYRKENIGYNVASKEKMLIPEIKYPAFSASRDLKITVMYNL